MYLGTFICIKVKDTVQSQVTNSALIYLLKVPIHWQAFDFVSVKNEAIFLVIDNSVTG